MQEVITQQEDISTSFYATGVPFAGLKPGVPTFALHNNRVKMVLVDPTMRKYNM